jgi:hypothetical protein
MISQLNNNPTQNQIPIGSELDGQIAQNKKRKRMSAVREGWSAIAGNRCSAKKRVLTFCAALNYANELKGNPKLEVPKLDVSVTASQRDTLRITDQQANIGKLATCKTRTSGV